MGTHTHTFRNISTYFNFPIYLKMALDFVVISERYYSLKIFAKLLIFLFLFHFFRHFLLIAGF